MPASSHAAARSQSASVAQLCKRYKLDKQQCSAWVAKLAALGFSKVQIDRIVFRKSSAATVYVCALHGRPLVYWCREGGGDVGGGE